MPATNGHRHGASYAPVEYRLPRNEGKPVAYVQHRESPARQEEGSSESAGDGHAVYHRPIDEPALGLDFSGDAFKFACSQRREKISCESSPLSTALGQPFSEEEFLPLGKGGVHLGAKARGREVIALIHQ